MPIVDAVEILYNPPTNPAGTARGNALASILFSIAILIVGELQDPQDVHALRCA